MPSQRFPEDEPARSDARGATDAASVGPVAAADASTDASVDRAEALARLLNDETPTDTESLARAAEQHAAFEAVIDDLNRFLDQ